MIVTRESFDSIVTELKKPSVYSVDTETTGLRAYQKDRLFSIIFGTSQLNTYYFNFKKYTNLDASSVLPRSWIARLQPVFSNPESLFFIANAKFDLGILFQEGIEIHGTIHCTEAIGRVERNDRFKIGLDALAKEIGLAKSDAVNEYIKKHKLYTKIKVPGKKQVVTLKHFDQVPFEVIAPYGEQDARVCMQVGLSQRSKIFTEGFRAELVAVNEVLLTKTFFEMEKVGVQVDTKFTKRQLDLETRRYQEAAAKWQELTHTPFNDSNVLFEKVFSKLDEKITLTEKGRPSFTKSVLRKMNNPLATAILEYRAAHKKAGTYFGSFLHLMDANGVIHPNYRQGGTVTGRVSCAEPNLQNLHKVDELIDEDGDALSPEEAGEVRRCFVPREGFYFVMIDYDQMEYRLMLDYAGEKMVIDAVLSGLDVHEATSQMVKVPRSYAKTLNFLLLYGGGNAKLAAALGISVAEASNLKAKYFARLPRVARFSRNVTAKARARKMIFNWAGRMCHFSDPNFAYTAPNHLIQGGCADVVKFSMNSLQAYLKGKKSRMILQIHDEVLFEIHETESNIVPELKAIMEATYKPKLLPLTCSVSHSKISWADKVKGNLGEKARDTVQGKSTPTTSDIAPELFR